MGKGNQAVDLVLSPKLEKFDESIPAILQNCGNFLFVAIEESDRMCLFTVDEQVVEELRFCGYTN
jgi:hypothetical protein